MAGLLAKIVPKWFKQNGALQVNIRALNRTIFFLTVNSFWSPNKRERGERDWVTTAKNMLTS